MKTGRTLILDSSIVAKWYKFDEAHYEEARRVKEDVLAGRTSASILEVVPLEVARALVKVERSMASVDAAYKSLQGLIEDGYLATSPITPLMADAYAVIRDYHLQTVDSLIVASAVSTGSDILTEDRHLLKRSLQPLYDEAGISCMDLETYRG